MSSLDEVVGAEVQLVEPSERMGREMKKTVRINQYCKGRRMRKEERRKRMSGIPRSRGHGRSPP